MNELFELLMNPPPVIEFDLSEDMVEAEPEIDTQVQELIDALEPIEIVPMSPDVTETLSQPVETVMPQEETLTAPASLGDNGANEWDTLVNFFIQPDQTALLFPEDFSGSGSFDSKNECIVQGDVLNDIQYVDQQTHASCSLMAQEQFIERYIGKDLPESYLEWQAEQWGVYTPEAGTSFFGQDALLDHFDIPHTRTMFADRSDLERALDENCDVLIGVDARYFYDDPTFPEGSGHAVAIVGKGVAPETGESQGYYVTDSNYPGTVRFVSTEAFDRCWWNDMITVPQSAVA